MFRHILIPSDGSAASQLAVNAALRMARESGARVTAVHVLPEEPALASMAAAQAENTILLDIAPETAVRRKATGRDRYERDLALLGRVRESYRRQATERKWVVIDAEMPKDDVAKAVDEAVLPRLAQPSTRPRS